jgi:hypothetical protein
MVSCPGGSGGGPGESSASDESLINQGPTNVAMSRVNQGRSVTSRMRLAIKNMRKA